MLNSFFQLLRDIQKKERTTGTLSEIDDTFYDDASKYLQELLEKVNDNPLSLEAYQLRDAQTITTEICERREFKIITTAITNVQKSHNFFKDNKDISKLYEEVPFNTTPEEVKLYKEVIDDYLNHRQSLSQGFSPNVNKKEETKIGFKPKKSQFDSIDEDLLNDDNNILDMIESSENKKEDESVIEEVKIEEDTSIGDNITKDDKKASTNKLDADEVMMMFGQAPDLLTDEENNPVKEKSKPHKNIMAPFEPPNVPKEDTVTLQNNKKDSSENNLNDDLNNEEIKSNKESNIDDNPADESKDNLPNEEVSVESNEFDEDELLVEFVDELTTDILDENEKTYGPFEIKDMALLPISIVKILKSNNVVNIVK